MNIERVIAIEDDLSALPAGRIDYTSRCGLVRAVIDSVRFEFYLEAAPEADPDVIDAFYSRVLIPLGMELIDEDECTPDMTDEGWTRIYAVPIEPFMPVDDWDGLAEAGYIKPKLAAYVGAAIFGAPALDLAVQAVVGLVTN